MTAPSRSRSDVVKLVVPVAVALIGAWATVSVGTADKVEDDQFSRVAVTNCQGINELRSVLREILAGAPVDPDNPQAGEQFIDDAVARLETRDCSRLVYGDG